MSEQDLEFQSVYEAYQPRILRYVARIAGAAEAEDLTQEVFVKVARSLNTFRGDSQLSTWIYRIATNTAIDRMRAASFQQEVESPSAEESGDEDEKEAAGEEERFSPERRLMRKEMQDCFMDCLNRLPVSYRAVVVLSELEEFSNQEIANILGLSLDVVKILLHRGRTRLLQALRENCKAEDWL